MNRNNGIIRSAASGCALSLLCIALASTGCASDQASRYFGSRTYPPRAPEEVALLFEPPSREYEVLAEFQSRGESPKDMQRKAAKIGADAVVVVLLGGYRANNDEWAGQDTQATSYSRITGTAILWKETRP